MAGLTAIVRRLHTDTGPDLSPPSSLALAFSNGQTASGVQAFHRRAPPGSRVREQHRVVPADGHLHDVRRRVQLRRRGSLCGVAQAQPPVVVVPARRPRLQSHTSTAEQQQDNAHQHADAQGERGALQLPSRVALLQHSKHREEGKQPDEKADARMAAPAKTMKHAPRRSHSQTPCGSSRRPRARRSSARPAAPACSVLTYRPGPAALPSSRPSPMPAITNTRHSTAAGQRS
eukprot:COSAG06_NODE_6956_length_2699_cov_4.983202_1_plen_232_part_00